MFYAKEKGSNRRISSFDTAPEQLRARARGGWLLCPDCDGELLYRESEGKRPHFYHRVRCSYKYSEPDGLEHLQAKVLLYDRLKQLFPHEVIELEYMVERTRQRSDVVILPARGMPICFEVQCLSMTEDLWRERHSLYVKAGVTDVWVLGDSLHTYGITDGRPDRSKHRLVGLEKAVFEGTGLLQYLNPETGIMRIVPGGSLNGSILSGFELCGLFSSSIFDKGRWWVNKAAPVAETPSNTKSEPSGGSAGHSGMSLLKYFDKQYQAQLREKWEAELVRHPVWLTASDILKLSVDQIPAYLNYEIDGDIIFNLDRRAWQSRVFAAFIYGKIQRYREPFPFKIKAVVDWILNKSNIPLNQVLLQYADDFLMRGRPGLKEVVGAFLDNLVENGFLECRASEGSPDSREYRIVKDVL